MPISSPRTLLTLTRFEPGGAAGNKLEGEWDGASGRDWYIVRTRWSRDSGMEAGVVVEKGAEPDMCCGQDQECEKGFKLAKLIGACVMPEKTAKSRL